MAHDPLESQEYDALRAEERDRMNGRTQIWTLYFTAVGAFSFVALQSGPGAYVVALCPLVLASLARHSRHSEDVLSQIRKYLYQLEERSGYQGYEHFTRTNTRKTHGGYRDALRDAFLLTDLLALGSVLVRMSVDHLFPAFGVLVALLDAFAMIMTWWWLSKRSRSRLVSFLSRTRQMVKPPTKEDKAGEVP